MQYAEIKSGNVVKPDWLKDSNKTDDRLGDYWMEITDPENERGEVVIAHYAVTDQECDFGSDPGDTGFALWHELLGAEVIGDHGTRYFSRVDLNSAGFPTADFDGWEGA